MADAIPVHSEPKRKVAVQPAPVDGNGVPVPADYASNVRENLGVPADFAGESDKTSEFTSTMEVPKLVDGKTVTVMHTHSAIRTDH